VNSALTLNPPDEAFRDPRHKTTEAPLEIVTQITFRSSARV